MPSVYIAPNGDVLSTNSGRCIAPAGTTAREARMQAALWAAAADALTNAPPAPTPITAAPSYQPAPTRPHQAVAVIDVARLHAETAEALTTLTKENPRCH